MIIYFNFFHLLFASIQILKKYLKAKTIKILNEKCEKITWNIVIYWKIHNIKIIKQKLNKKHLKGCYLVKKFK